MTNLVQTINGIDIKILFFILIVLILCFCVFTHNTAMIDLAKMLLAAYAGYLTGTNKPTV